MWCAPTLRDRQERAIVIRSKGLPVDFHSAVSLRRDHPVCLTVAWDSWGWASIHHNSFREHIAPWCWAMCERSLTKKCSRITLRRAGSFSGWFGRALDGRGFVELVGSEVRCTPTHKRDNFVVRFERCYSAIIVGRSIWRLAYWATLPVWLQRNDMEFSLYSINYVLALHCRADPLSMTYCDFTTREDAINFCERNGKQS